MMTVLLFAGCGIESNQTGSNYTNSTVSHDNETNEEAIEMDAVTFSEGSLPEGYWDTVEFPVNQVCVPSHEAALKLAECMLENFHEGGVFTNYVCSLSVFLDTQSQVWIVTFGISKEPYLGELLHIAIRRDSAEVVKIWVEE
jgi:hypothetical protein